MLRRGQVFEIADEQQGDDAESVTSGDAGATGRSRSRERQPITANSRGGNRRPILGVALIGAAVVVALATLLGAGERTVAHAPPAAQPATTPQSSARPHRSVSRPLRSAEPRTASVGPAPVRRGKSRLLPVPVVSKVIETAPSRPLPAQVSGDPRMQPSVAADRPERRRGGEFTFER